MYIVALDIGGTNVRAAIVNEKGEICEVIKEPTTRHDLEKFITQVVRIVGKLNLAKYSPIAISIGTAGRVRMNGFIDESPNIGILNCDLITPLNTAYHLPVSVRNDAEMAGYAEASLGVGKNAKSTYFITISTGIGGCLIVDGKIKNPSVEIGHTLVPYKDGFYELEKIASGDGVIKMAAMNNVIFKQGKDFFAAVSNNEEQVLPIYKDWLTLIIDFFQYVTHSFTPDVIAVTGGVLKSKHLFWDDLIKAVPDTKIAIAHFSEDAGLVGSAMYGFAKFSNKQK